MVWESERWWGLVRASVWFGMARHVIRRPPRAHPISSPLASRDGAMASRHTLLRALRLVDPWLAFGGSPAQPSTHQASAPGRAGSQASAPLRAGSRGACSSRGRARAGGSSSSSRGTSSRGRARAGGAGAARGARAGARPLRSGGGSPVKARTPPSYICQHIVHSAMREYEHFVCWVQVAGLLVWVAVIFCRKASVMSSPWRCHSLAQVDIGVSSCVCGQLLSLLQWQP